jgi:hypothetical protein
MSTGNVSNATRPSFQRGSWIYASAEEAKVSRRSRNLIHDDPRLCPLCETQDRKLLSNILSDATRVRIAFIRNVR